jgi:hypothetical protein
MMSAFCPLSPARSDHSAQQTDRAAIRSEKRRPVPSSIAPQQPRLFQSNADFETPRWAVAIDAIAVRSERLTLPVAFAGFLCVLTPLCMALAGGTPA